MELHSSSSSNYNHIIARPYSATKGALRFFLGTWLIALLILFVRQAALSSVLMIGAIILFALCISIILEKRAHPLPALMENIDSLPCTIVRDSQSLVVDAPLLCVGDVIYTHEKPREMPHHMADQADYQASNTMGYSSYSWVDYAIEQARFTLRKTQWGMRYLFSYVCAQISILIGALLLGLPELFTIPHVIVLAGITVVFLYMLINSPFSYPIPSYSKRLFTIEHSVSISMFTVFRDCLPMLVGAGLIFYANYTDNLAYARTMALMTCIVLQLYRAWNYRITITAFQRAITLRPLVLDIGITSMVILLCIAMLYVPCAQHILQTVALSASDWKIIFLVVIPLILIEQGIALMQRYRCQD